jgi:hypothetical protein
MTEIKIEGVRINLPPDITASHIIGPSGHSYQVNTDADGVRWIDMTVKDCEAMLPSAAPHIAPWRTANPTAFQRVGGQVKKPEPGVRIADRLHAGDMAPRDPRDLGGISADTMRIIRGIR